MAEPRESASTHPQSRRTAIIDRAGQALWLYLTEPGSLSPVNDCWLANCDDGREPLSADEMNALRAGGLPPPAPAGLLKNAVKGLPEDPRAYELDWSGDGEAVQALLDDEPVAFIVADVKDGFHADLRTDCPWGRMFDAGLHQQLFDRRGR